VEERRSSKRLEEGDYSSSFKKGNVEDIQNYRCISVLCAAYKAYVGILNERLKND